MPKYSGMDAVEIRRLSRAMTQTASELTGLAASATAEIAALPWQGPDRERFLAEWQGHARALQQAASGLNQASVEASRSAEAQERASAR
jgi:uncharacterized protein YukE